MYKYHLMGLTLIILNICPVAFSFKYSPKTELSIYTHLQIYLIQELIITSKFVLKANCNDKKNISINA